MRNIKLDISYDGTKYYGWQKQKDKKTVQETIEKAIFEITGKKIKLIGSGRTDRGVSAISQVANFLDESKFDIEKYEKAINSRLKREYITINKVEEVDIDFNARFNAKEKTYIYIINNNKQRGTITRDHEYYYPYSLDVNNMNKAIQEIVGEHNFKCFEAAGSKRDNTIRIIYDAKVYKEKINNLFNNSERIIISVTGNGFLYNMMRIIAGTMLEVGRGNIKVKDIKTIIEKEDRKNSGKTLPPEGLILKEVKY